jgi:Flp pilus assembly pilin Flp
MRRTQLNPHAPAQSLVEYALLLVLVTVVVIGIVYGVGLAAQRIFGQISGTLGTRRDVQGEAQIVIEVAQCISVAALGQTGIWVTGTTNVPVAELRASTESGLGAVSGGGGTFRYNPVLAATADVSKCPRSVVIQSSNGKLAVAPLEIVVR